MHNESTLFGTSVISFDTKGKQIRDDNGQYTNGALEGIGFMTRMELTEGTHYLKSK